MLKESTIKPIIYFLTSVLDFTFLVAVVFYKANPVYFLIVFCFGMLVLLVVECYLRLQHNTDLKAQEISRLISVYGSENKNGISKLHSKILLLSKDKIGRPVNYDKKINVEKADNAVFISHRSGWIYVLDLLTDLNERNGTLLLGFIEKKFRWGSGAGDQKNGPLPIKEPWIGFFHSAINYPYHEKDKNPENIFMTEQWEKSEEYCKGIFCFSKYQKDWLERMVKIPVENLYHPTGKPQVFFDFDLFVANKEKKLVQVGETLRKMASIYRINPKISRGVIVTDKYDYLLGKETGHLPAGSLDYASVEKINYLSDLEYDVFLSKNIVFLDLWDVAASNTIIECIVRNTPLLINRLPAVMEYLGADYPFYFNNLPEAEKKADDFELIKKTHEYLKNLPIKNKLTGEYFLDSFAKSEIYKNLPNPLNNN